MASFAESYDLHRPRPPTALLELLARLAGPERPVLVVDLGSGTGLSARAWTGWAERVVGIEPDDAMRAVAERVGAGVEYVAAEASATGLPTGCADVVTCSQSLHWMEPGPTFEEVGRILRPGGVFAAYDYDPVPLVHPDVDAAFEEMLDRARTLREQSGVWSPWTATRPVREKDHVPRMRESGRFRYVREVVLHSVEQGDAGRLIGFLRSFGGIEVHKDRLPLDGFERVVRSVLGDRAVPLWFGYRVRVGFR